MTPPGVPSPEPVPAAVPTPLAADAPVVPPVAIPLACVPFVAVKPPAATQTRKRLAGHEARRRHPRARKPATVAPNILTNAIRTIQDILAHPQKVSASDRDRPGPHHLRDAARRTC